MGRKRTSDRFDDVGSSSGEDSDRSHDAPRRQKRRQGNGIEGKIRKAIQKQATNLKTQAGFLQRLSKIFGPVDDWGIQEVPKKVFAEELTRIVEDVTDMRTASKKFGIAMDKMLDSIDTDENDSISFAEFVAFYAFKEDELRKLVVNISKKVNQQAGDEHYVRRWLKTTAARKLPIEVQIMGDEDAPVWAPFTQQMKASSTSIAAKRDACVLHPLVDVGAPDVAARLYRSQV